LQNKQGLGVIQRRWHCAGYGTVLAMAVTKKGLINTLKFHDCRVVNRKKVISYSTGEIRKVSLASLK